MGLADSFSYVHAFQTPYPSLIPGYTHSLQRPGVDHFFSAVLFKIGSLLQYRFQAGGCEYELTFQHTGFDDLQNQIDELARDMEDIADSRNGGITDLETGERL